MIPLLAALLAGMPPADSTVAYTVNGVRVIQRIDTTTKLMAVGVYFLGGTRILTPATAGIEDLFFHAAGRGSKKYPVGAGTKALARTGSFFSLSVERTGPPSGSRDLPPTSTPPGRSWPTRS